MKYDRYGNSLMKDYLVTCNLSTNYFGMITDRRSISLIVSAKDVADAINQAYERYIDTVYKEDITARSLASLHSEHGKIIKLEETK